MRFRALLVFGTISAHLASSMAADVPASALASDQSVTANWIALVTCAAAGASALAAAVSAILTLAERKAKRASEELKFYFDFAHPSEMPAWGHDLLECLQSGDSAAIEASIRGRPSIRPWHRRLHLARCESIEFMIASGLMAEDVAYFSFGSMAIAAWDSEAMWEGITPGKDSESWGAYKYLIEQRFRRRRDEKREYHPSIVHFGRKKL